MVVNTSKSPSTYARLLRAQRPAPVSLACPPSTHACFPIPSTKTRMSSTLDTRPGVQPRICVLCLGSRDTHTHARTHPPFTHTTHYTGTIAIPRAEEGVGREEDSGTTRRLSKEGRKEGEAWTSTTPRIMQSRTARYVGQRQPSARPGKDRHACVAVRPRVLTLPSPSLPPSLPFSPPRCTSCSTQRYVVGRIRRGWAARGAAGRGDLNPFSTPSLSSLSPPPPPPQALKRGEPLTEESIRWLLELHGEMFLIEQHYSTRTRLRRLALNGTPVAVRF